MTNFLIYYFIGLAIAAIMHFVYKVYIEKNTEYNKKQYAYISIKFGLFSWFAVIFYVIIVIVYFVINGLDIIDEWIKEKLK